MEFVVARSNSELYHHGVKGMKWGVRRYQNKNGSLTNAGKKKLETYRNKELERNEKKWNNASELKRRVKVSNKIEKAKASGNQKRVEKFEKQRKELDMTMKYNTAMKAVERSKIKNMSFSQMQNERHQVKVKSGKAAMESVLVTTLASAVLLPTTGRVYIHTTVANPDAIKTNMRVSSKEAGEVYKRTHK